MIIRDELAMSLAVLLNDIKALFPPKDLTQRSSLESGWPRGTSSISTGTWSVAAPSRRREEICEFPLPSKWTSENERREMSSEDSPKVADDICFVNDFDWSRLPPWRQQTTTDLENTGLFGAIGKAELAGSLDAPAYTVEQFYKDSGMCQLIARSSWFQNVTLCIIVVNAGWIGYDADQNQSNSLYASHWQFVIMENLFCSFYTLELFVRFGAFARKWNCCTDSWFKFDACLLAMMIVETWVLAPVVHISGNFSSGVGFAPLRLLRLLRLTRIARIMRSMPELVTMMKGMALASRAVASSLMMVGMLVYIFSIIMLMLVGDVGNVKYSFGTLPRCMWTLLMDGTFMDSTGIILTRMLSRGQVNTHLAVGVFLVFVLLSAFTVMNMLIGVLCEVVTAVGKAEQDEAAVKMVKETILVQLKNCDADNNGHISKEELSQVMCDQDALGTLSSLNIDLKFLLETWSYLFSSDEVEVPMITVMEYMLMYRGDLNVRVEHLVNAHSLHNWQLNRQFRRHEERLRHWLESMSAHLASTMKTYLELTLLPKSKERDCKRTEDDFEL